MAKDRARPFSRKHRRYWLTVTGGMILIMAINLVTGVIGWPHRADERLPPKAITFDVPQATGDLAVWVDAGVDGGAAVTDAAP